MLILASTSKYRKNLLSRLNIPFECQAPNVDEGPIKHLGLQPKEVSLRLSELKAEDVFKRNPDAVVIGSDQVCAFENQILGKSGSKPRSAEILEALSGKSHFLYSSVTVQSKNNKISWTHETRLVMRKLSSRQIDRYLDLDQPYDCAGSYKIEASGIALFESIECDDFTGIEGLPLIRLAKELENFGFQVFN